MIGGIHHLGLTVRDADASAAWYVDVLGFRRVGEFESPDGARRKVFLRHDGFQIRLGLTQHRGGARVHSMRHESVWTTSHSQRPNAQNWTRGRRD